MKLNMSGNNLAVVGLLAVAALGAAFWMLALSPKREEAAALEAEVTQLKSTLAQHEAEIVAGEEAREDFPVDYQKLVVLGKAVPGDDDVASLLVQLNRIADNAGAKFADLQLGGGGGGGGGGEEAAPETAAPTEGATPTEAAAALLPLGATIGPAGLGVMPYTLTFDGNFFAIADFIKGLDSLVQTRNERVRVDGRLMTIDEFSLSSGDENSASLTANFTVTTYLTPPGEEPAIAPESSGAAEAAPVAATIGVAR